MQEPITWRTFRPSLKGLYHECWLKAKDRDWRQEYFSYDKCSVCGRTIGDMLAHWENNQMLYICSDHGGVWFDSRTGYEVVQSTMPYWKRRWRNRLLTLKIWMKYFWYLISDAFLWYIYWPIRYWNR